MALGRQGGCSETPLKFSYAVGEPFVVAIGQRLLRLRNGVHLIMSTPRFWEPVTVVAATSDARVDKSWTVVATIRHAPL